MVVERRVFDAKIDFDYNGFNTLEWASAET